MLKPIALAAALLFVLAVAQPAAADVTAFVGVSPTPENRAVRGFAAGFSFLVVGFEFEYADAVEDLVEGLPGLRTGSANVVVQTPMAGSGLGVYATAGAGIYRERLDTVEETAASTNIGGGAKIRLVGPLQLRLDYRIFRLQGSPLHQVYQRFYVGANLGF